MEDANNIVEVCRKVYGRSVSEIKNRDAYAEKEMIYIVGKHWREVNLGMREDDRIGKEESSQWGLWLVGCIYATHISDDHSTLEDEFPGSLEGLLRADL